MTDRVQPAGSPLDGTVLHHVVPRDTPTWLLDLASGMQAGTPAGGRYLDTTSGECSRRPSASAAAMARQASRLCFTHPYGAASALELASRISAVSPIGPTALYFCNSGSQAMEAAVKFARQCHLAAGEPQRWRVVARRGDYHGSTLGAGRHHRQRPHAQHRAPRRHRDPTSPATRTRSPRAASGASSGSPHPVAGWPAPPPGGRDDRAGSGHSPDPVDTAMRALDGALAAIASDV